MLVQQVPSLILSSGCCFHVLPLSMWVESGFSGFFLPHKNAGRLLCYSKAPSTHIYRKHIENIVTENEALRIHPPRGSDFTREFRSIEDVSITLSSSSNLIIIQICVCHFHFRTFCQLASPVQDGITV